MHLLPHSDTRVYDLVRFCPDGVPNSRAHHLFFTDTLLALQIEGLRTLGSVPNSSSARNEFKHTHHNLLPVQFDMHTRFKITPAVLRTLHCPLSATTNPRTSMTVMHGMYQLRTSSYTAVWTKKTLPPLSVLRTVKAASSNELDTKPSYQNFCPRQRARCVRYSRVGYSQ